MQLLFAAHISSESKIKKIVFVIHFEKCFCKMLHFNKKFIFHSRAICCKCKFNIFILIHSIHFILLSICIVRLMNNTSVVSKRIRFPNIPNIIKRINVARNRMNPEVKEKIRTTIVIVAIRSIFHHSINTNRP